MLSRLPAQRMLLAGLLIVVAVVALKFLVMLAEPHMVFFPPARPFEAPESAGLPYEDVVATTEDGLALRSWLFRADRAASSAPAFTILFFHGNAEDISQNLDMARAARRIGCNLLLAEYRGYGGNAGAPSEIGLYRDGDAALAAVRRLEGIDPARLVVWGRSIGATVAIHLAAADAGRLRAAPGADRPGGAGAPPLAGLIVESAFTSGPDLLREGGSVVLRVLALFGRYRFDNAGRMARVTAPVLAIHGTADEVVPFALGERLFAAAPRQAGFAAVEGGGHNDLSVSHGAEVWEAVARYIEALAAEPATGR
jgi:hypothetical protein